MRRFIIEFGLGTDFHGQDVSKAAQKAVKVNVTVAVSRPEAVDTEAVKSCLPVGEVEVHAVAGGLNFPGLYIPGFGDSDDSIEVAVAAIEVFVP